MSNKIKFSELGEAIAVQSGLSKQLANNFLRKLFDYIEDGLYKDGLVRVPGIGTFRLKWKDGREGINPRTGETIDIKGHNQILFRPEAGLKRFINADYEHLKSEVIEEKIEELPVIENSENKKIPEIISEPFEEELLDTKDEIPEEKEKVIITTPFEEEFPEEKLKFEKNSKLVFNDILKENGKEQKVSFPSAAASTYEFNPKISEIPKFKDSNDDYVEDKKLSFKSLLIILALLGLLAAVIYFAIFYKSDNSVRDNKTITLVDDKDKEINATKIDSSKVVTKINEESHTVVKGDKLWSLAKSTYEDPYLWPNIYRVNSNNIKNPDIIKIGQEITVPLLEGDANNLTNKDLQNISNGYEEVYNVKKKQGKKDAKSFLSASKKYEKMIK
ncbi:MAG: HU family DNA-binding protein [Ignavibacteriales bacterium]|nr:HU family DNA-binding protein [Ignavibacteriales bacterium]